MKWSILLSLVLVLLLPVTAICEEYLIRIEFVEASYDEETSIDDLLETLTVMQVEAMVSPGQEFEVSSSDGERKLTMKGTVATLQGTELGIRNLSIEQENRGSAGFGAAFFDLSALKQISGGMRTQTNAEGKRTSVINKYLKLAWQLPIDEAALAKKEQAIQEARVTLMRNHMLNLRQQEFTKQKAAVILLELARQQLAAGDSRVGLLLLGSFDFQGTEVEQEAAEVRKSLALQSKHVEIQKVPLP